MKEVGSRLLTLRKQMKLTQVQFAKEIGITQNVYTRYETGKLDLPDHLKSKLHQIGVNLNWLLTGKGQMFQELVPMDASILSDTIRLPISAEIAAGEPCEVILDEPLGWLDIPKQLLHFPPPYFMFRVKGRSMEPHILNGDIVICSRDWRGQMLHGKILAFRTPDGITLKRLALDDKHRVTWLMPINHEFTPMVYMEDSEELCLIGLLDIAIRGYNRE